MKIDNEALLKMQKKYVLEMGAGKQSLNSHGNEIKKQTRWMYFDKKTLLDLLEQTGDNENSGIKIYITQHTEQSASLAHPESPSDYDGRLTLVLAPAILKDGSYNDIDGWLTGGEQECPYVCAPPIFWDTFLGKEELKSELLEKSEKTLV